MASRRTLKRTPLAGLFLRLDLGFANDRCPHGQRTDVTLADQLHDALALGAENDLLHAFMLNHQFVHTVILPSLRDSSKTGVVRPGPGNRRSLGRPGLGRLGPKISGHNLLSGRSAVGHDNAALYDGSPFHFQNRRVQRSVEHGRLLQHGVFLDHHVAVNATAGCQPADSDSTLDIRLAAQDKVAVGGNLSLETAVDADGSNKVELSAIFSPDAEEGISSVLSLFFFLNRPMQSTSLCDGERFMALPRTSRIGANRIPLYPCETVNATSFWPGLGRLCPQGLVHGQPAGAKAGNF